MIIRSGHLTLGVTGFVSFIAFTFILSSAQAQTTTTGGGGGSSPTLEVPVQSPAAQPSTTTSTGTNTISAPFKINAPQIGDFKLRAGVKTTDTSGRLYDLDNTKGTRLRQKHEYFLGFVHATGWGAYAQGVTSGTTFAEANSNANTLGGGDASLTILHPDYYKGTSMTISGQFRRYLAVTDRSKDRGQKQWAYYLYTTYKLPAQWGIWNQATPRYFEQSYYKTTDTTLYFEDITTLTKAISTHWAAGVGQWTQVEGHSETPTGVSVDAQIFARYMPIANIWIEPRIVAPVYIKNAVFDQSRNVSLQGLKAELYAQMTL